MARFTDSPFESMMMEKPAGNVRAPWKTGDSPYPAGHRCRGCPYGRERPCLGVCIRDMEPRRGRKEV